jgi:16S rRNA (cytidine1402-2'-O)-methyltransferase
MSSAKTGSLYLIPCLLGDASINTSLPSFNKEIVNSIDEYIVEDVRSARRFLIKMGIITPIDNLTFHLLNEHTSIEQVGSCIEGLLQGKNVGLLSDAGCPGIADPGAEVIKLAHKHSIKVIPLIGPSSILLALISSGLNGQNFAFHGYLPKQKPERVSKLRQLETESLRENRTQIFIETPYRNDALFEDILSSCKPETLLCIASDITLQTEYIHTKTVKEWQSQKRSFNDHPAVFLIGCNQPITNKSKNYR